MGDVELILATVSLVVAIGLALAPGRRGDEAGVDDVDVVDLAMLRDGRRAAVLTALTGMLERDEAVLVRTRGLRRGKVPATGTLERQVWRELQGWAAPRQVVHGRHVAAALREREDDLAAWGLLQPRPWWLVRRLLVVAAGLTGAVLAGGALLTGPQPPGVVGGVVVLAGAVVVWRTPRRTPAGDRVLRAVREAVAVEVDDAALPASRPEVVAAVLGDLPHHLSWGSAAASLIPGSSLSSGGGASGSASGAGGASAGGGGGGGGGGSW
jgi:uncharacterized protein (TIGR04222 family)